MGITKERVSHDNGNGQIHYRALIRSFRDKMRNWNPGRVVRLKPVTVDGVPLKLLVYPNGDEKDSAGYISYYIENLGAYDIEVDFELQIKEMNMEQTEFPISAFQSFGHTKYFHHDKILGNGCYGDDDDSDEALEIQWTIKKVWKDVDSFNLSNNSLSSKIEKTAENTKSLQDNLAKLSEKYNSLTESLKKIETEMNKDKKKIPLPECPVCSNELGLDVKIAQCPSGHLLCWTCKERMSVPQCITQCPSCQAPVVNRAHGMESYIKTLLQ